MAVITGSFNSLVSGTISGVFQNTAGGVLSGVIGTPGPAGAPGTPGAPGAPGEPGQGVPVGGSAGQALVKIDGTNYNTEWSSLPAFLTKAGNLSGLTDLATARDNLGLGEGNEVTFLALSTINGDLRNYLDGSGLQVTNLTTGNFVWVKSDSIQFADSTIQTTAFPGASGFAPIYSPVFTGNPRAPTPATNDNDTSIATTAFVKAQGYITSAPVTSVAGRTGVITLSNTDISGLGSLAVVNDAPSDGSQYARQNGAWSVVSAGGSYLPLSGGTLSGTLFVPTIRNILNTNLVIDAYNDTGAGTHNYFNFNPYGGGFELPSGSAGITFGDATVQTTAWTGTADGYRLLTDYDFTNVADEKLTGFGMTLNKYATYVTYDSFLTADALQLHADRPLFSAGWDTQSLLSKESLVIKRQEWQEVDGTYQVVDSLGIDLSPVQGFKFINWDGSLKSGYSTYGPTSITFPNASVQTIAFPGFNNVALTGNPTAPTPATSDNDTSIATTAYVKAQAFGDRYLTTSTTSNTINNANKTFTIGTGLSYTPTQNITISYDAANHMHGEVLTYSTSTGVLTVDIKNHTGSGTYAAWVVNVGGVTPATSVAWGGITGTLSTQTDLQAALDLKANLASPAFTGTPSLPTGTTGITQTAGDNTTALATTAFVTAAVPAFATNAQAVAGTSTTTTLAPAAAVLSQLSPSNYTPSPAQFSLATVGTGATGALAANGFTLVTPNTVVGSAARSVQTYVQGAPANGTINWTKPAGFSGKYISFYRYSTVATARVSLGKVGGTVGVPTVRSIGFKMTASANAIYDPLVLEVHDGTTLTTVTSSFTPLLNKVFEVLCYSDGAGNVTLYVNNVAVATSSAGPKTITGSQVSQEISLVHEISQAATPPGAPYESYFVVQNPKFLST